MLWEGWRGLRILSRGWDEEEKAWGGGVIEGGINDLM